MAIVLRPLEGVDQSGCFSGVVRNLSVRDSAAPNLSGISDPDGDTSICAYNQAS